MGGYGWISLTTDYGTFDGFAAACHGAIARIAPEVRVIDITHHVPPADVARGAAVLAQTAPHLPPSVHVAVVDPGVGTARRGIAIGTPDGILVGPDNGLLIWAAEALGGIDSVVELANKDWFLGDVSRTFHGRDVFAPAAARLAAGRAAGRRRAVRRPGHAGTPARPDRDGRRRLAGGRGRSPSTGSATCSSPRGGGMLSGLGPGAGDRRRSGPAGARPSPTPRGRPARVRGLGRPGGDRGERRPGGGRALRAPRRRRPRRRTLTRRSRADHGQMRWWTQTLGST